MKIQMLCRALPVLAVSFLAAGQAAAQDLAAAVLPNSRSVEVGATATAFVTVVNSGAVAATGCTIAPAVSLPSSFSFQATDSTTNAVIGVANAPVNIAAGGSRSFVVAFRPTASFAATEVAFNVACANAGPAPVTSGVNTLLLAASDTPISDVVAVAGTLSNNGVVTISGDKGTGVFVVASSNLGAGGDVTVTASIGGVGVDASVMLCETLEDTGACLANPTQAVATNAISGQTSAFSVFVTTNASVPLDPASNRVFVTFRDGNGAVVGMTSVALQTLTLDTPSVAQVQQIIAQAVEEALLLGAPATIAVVDRVGNVLGIFEMNGAAGQNVLVDPGRTSLAETPGRVVNLPALDPNNGLNNVALPLGRAAAVAKAITGAYLSSSGNAFTSRTASQIVQENFNPGEVNQNSGPLFGVQFSSLPCSDLVQRGNTTAGPHRTPLGLSADPGGLPLYLEGQVVGGIGVMSDGVYGVDLSLGDIDNNTDELIAMAGQRNFEPPDGIRANMITVEGKSFRYTDRPPSALLSDPALVRSFAAINGTEGNLVALGDYNAGAIVAGSLYGTAASGYVEAPAGLFPAVRNFVPFILVDTLGNNRHPPRAGTDGILTQAESVSLVSEALNIAGRGRAQIRRPLNSFIQVTVSLVDTNGEILAVARTPDGPIFGTDVSLQKARTAAFFSSPQAAADLLATPNPSPPFPVTNVSGYVSRARNFLGDPTALANGIAFADRSGGNLSRPFYPDGISGNGPGPFSVPFEIWSPFNTGLQFDAVSANVIQHLLFLLPDVAIALTGGTVPDVGASCTSIPNTSGGSATRLANGFQIFPGSVPVYKNGVLAGGLGVSGDGVDQDDMISFLGVFNAGEILGTGVGHADPSIRADTINVHGARLRYVNCPFKPFIDSNEQNVCSGK